MNNMREIITLINNLTETEIIEPLTAEDVEETVSFLTQEVSANQPVGKYKEASYYDIKYKGSTYIVLTEPDTNEVIYFVKHRPVSIDHIAAGRQVLVWRNTDSYYAAGFAVYIFFNVLLPKYKVLFADVQQTPMGKQFWGYGIKKAYDDGLYVYYVDERGSFPKIVELPTPSEFNKNKNQIWGIGNDYKRIYAVISSVKL